MQPTQETLDRYKGGQAEIQKLGNVYRGEIAEISVGPVDDVLLIKFAWLARMDPPMCGKWVKDVTSEYAADLEFYAASDIGNGRLWLNNFVNGEVITLFPPGGSALEPSKVEGLELTAS